MTSLATLTKPSEELSKKIRAQINENETTRDKDIQLIKEWLKQQPHLPDDWDSQCILSFLRGCDFSLERCKQKLDMYFTMRAACPDWFTNRDITRPELSSATVNGLCLPLPGMTPKGYRITVAKGKIDPLHLNNSFKITLMIGDIKLKEEVFAVAGDVCIVDGSLTTMSHLAKLSVTTMKKFLLFYQEASPTKLKEIHLVNISGASETLLSLVKPFLKEKMRNRIFVHADWKSLHKHIPKDLLPEEFGGTAGQLNQYHEAWNKKLEDYKDWFKAEESLKANESLRPGKPTNYDELFGFQGSFRQLSLD